MDYKLEIIDFDKFVCFIRNLPLKSRIDLPMPLQKSFPNLFY